MNNIFEVNVTTTAEEVHSMNVFGLMEAVSFANASATCINVTNVDVIDTMTGEVMYLIQDGLVTWVSGIGNPFEVLLGAGE